jgi:hypothetical protein
VDAEAQAVDAEAQAEAEKGFKDILWYTITF